MSKARDRFERLRAWVPYLWDCVGLTGIALLLKGVWEIHEPTAFIVAGLSLLLVAFLLARPMRKPETEEQR